MPILDNFATQCLTGQFVACPFLWTPRDFQFHQRIFFAYHYIELDLHKFKFFKIQAKQVQMINALGILIKSRIIDDRWSISFSASDESCKQKFGILDIN